MKRKVIAVKHNRLRNDDRSPNYWTLESIDDNINEKDWFSNAIYTTWFEKDLNRKVKRQLNKSKSRRFFDFDISEPLKRGEFEITFTKEAKFGIIDSNSIIEIKKI